METNTSHFKKNSEVRREQRTKVFFVGILLLIILIVSGIAFLRKQEFQITDITITDTRSLDPNQVKTIAQEYLQGNYALIIPKTNMLLFSKRGMKYFLLDRIPSLESVTIDFTTRNALTITVQEKKPQFVWCDAIVCYFIDSTGIIYKEAPIFSDGAFITFSGGDMITGDPLKQRFVSESAFMNITQILEFLQKYPVHILGVRYTETDDIEIRVDQIRDMMVNAQAKILISPMMSGESIGDALDLILSDKAFSGQVKTNGSRLEYLDLRFAGKIYYKFSGESLSTD